ncbi:unnamed protein product [Symbiodinium sp. CCMP2592]|nr:unnamed protein product [Symbiodinium sp. CCMP2592]
MPRRRLPWWCPVVFVVRRLSCAAPSAFAADKVGLRTRVSAKRTCSGAQRDRAPEWASKLPHARTSPRLLETLATAVPALQLGGPDGPLSEAVKVLAEGHTVLRDSKAERNAALLVLLASSGKGKTRFLYELNERLQQEKRAMCIPITFNGLQTLESDAQTVHGLTKEPEEKAIVHVALRLLQATFEINDLQVFAESFCESLGAASVPLTVSLLRKVVAVCAETREDIKNVTILVDESGRLPKLLNMSSGDGDEFSALRSLCRPGIVDTLGFSVMLMQAGLGDFAEQTVSQRDVKVIVLLEQEVEDALQNWVLYEAESRESVQRWADKIAELCSGSLKTKANTELFKKLVLRPLVVEYVPLARGLEYLTEAVKQFDVSDAGPITTNPELGSRMRQVGLELRDLVDGNLNVRYSIVAQRLTPAVLAPAILPSHRLLVSLDHEIGGHRVSKLLSEAAYSNTLEELRPDAVFLPEIVPAFLRQAAQKQPDLHYLQAWWTELEEVLKAQASGTADAGNLLDVGVRLWTYTILLALSENQPTLKVTLADIFPDCVTHRGLEAADYKMQVPNAVTLKALQEPLNASTNILQFAVEQAREGAATVLGMADGQAGVDSVVVLPLPRRKVLLLGLEPHGGGNRGVPDKRHEGHPQDKRSVFWQGLPSEIQGEKDVRFALLYITHDDLVDKTSVLEKKRNSTVLRDCNSSSDVVNLLLMDRSGLQSFFGPLWPLYAQARCIAR